ncbi:MAG: hypothetical protein CL676_03495 [Bdellovibrionaceae bacterium]|nr:hypothetical protein [Pseudobdellovibrionaceae bacterium]
MGEILNTEEKLKYFEFIQNVINRMAQNSFILKGWIVTLASGLMALAAHESDKRFIAVIYFCAPLFFMLDGYFLHQERMFRELFREAVDGKASVFSMDTSSYNKGRNTWWNSCFSRTVWPLYAVILGITLLIMFGF